MKCAITISLTFLLLYPGTEAVLAQNGRGVIRGRTVSPDGTPSFVTVSLKHLQKTTVTDNEGHFSLVNLAPLEDTLVISSVQAKTLLVPVRLKKNEVLNLGTLGLEFSYSALQDIEISTYSSHSYKSDYSFFTTKTQTPYLDIPQSVSSITREVIDDRMQYVLKEAATDAAGMTDYSGYDEYTIRGFKAENARLINGLRGYNSSFTSPLLVNIERIEIIKGPSATLYGNSDPGGTINLVTKKPQPQNEASMRVSAGTWNHTRALADVTGPLSRNKKWLYRFNGGYDHTHTFRAGIFERSYELCPSVSFIPNDRFKLNMDVSLTNIHTVLDRGQPGFENDLSLRSTPVSLTVSQPGDFLHETDLASNVLLSYQLNKHISFNSGYLNYITWQQVHEHGLHSYITPDSVNLYFSRWNYHTVTNTLTNYLTIRYRTGNWEHQLIAGLDFIQSRVILNQQYLENPSYGTGAGIVGTFSLKRPVDAIQNPGDLQLSAYQSDATSVDGTVYSTVGGYFQDQASFKKWKILAGIREELYHSGDDGDSLPEMRENVFLPRLGLVFALQPDLSIYATYNKGFDPFEVSTSTQVFNAPFKPVTSQLLEAGAKGIFFNNRLNASVSVYQLTLHHVAVNANVLSNPDLFVQQGADRSTGIEVECTGNLLPNLSVSLSYAYCMARVLKSTIPSMDGTLVENAPKHISNSWFKYSFQKGWLSHLSVAAGHSQASAKNTLQPGLVIPGYMILDGGLQYRVHRVRVAVNVFNITNRAYWLGAYNVVSKWPGPPRNALVELGYDF